MAPAEREGNHTALRKHRAGCMQTLVVGQEQEGVLAIN